MQVDTIMPAPPRAAAPSPNSTAAAQKPGKSGSFASILEEEQAGLASTKEAAPAEEKVTKTDDEAAEVTDETAEETEEAAKQVAALQGAQMASAQTPVETPVAVEAPTEDMAVEGSTEVTAPAVDAGADNPTETAAALANATAATATESAPETAQTETKAPVAAVEAPVEAKPVVVPAASTEAKDETATFEAAVPADKPAIEKPAAEKTVAPATDTQVAAKPVKPETTAAESAAAEEAALSAKPTDVSVEPSASKVAGKPAKAPAAPVNGAQPTVQVAGDAQTPDAVTATKAPDESAFRDALAAQSTESAPDITTAETSDTDAASNPSATAGTPTVNAKAPLETARVHASENAHLPASTPANVQDPGEIAIKSIRYMAQNGETRLTVRLEPESLGHLIIQVSSGEGGLDVQLTATQAGAREVLEKQIATLRDTLSREGLVVTKVSVTADLTGQQQFQQTGGRHMGADTAPGRFGPAPQHSPYRVTTPMQAHAARASRHNGALDLYA